MNKTLLGFVSKIPRKNFSKNFSKLHKMTKPIEKSMESKLTGEFAPKYLHIMNESYMHNVPKGSETHFKLVVVSDKFTNLPILKRHKLVYAIVAEELRNGVHALSIDAKTPEQWENSAENVESSPKCLGGFGK